MASKIEHARQDYSDLSKGGPGYQAPKRGWVRVVIGSSVLDVRKGYRAVKCDGDAHSNAHIDNCMVCLNHTWGWIAVAD